MTLYYLDIWEVLSLITESIFYYSNICESLSLVWMYFICLDNWGSSSLTWIYIVCLDNLVRYTIYLVNEGLMIWQSVTEL